jgi:AcrR family transcriptional regulator
MSARPPLQEPAPRLDARQARSRKALNLALFSLLEEKPFDRITIREISDRAGTGYATFFRHYTSKEALLEDLAEGEIDALMQRIVPILETADSPSLGAAICDYVEGHRAVWAALLTGGASGIMREAFTAHTLALHETIDPASTWLPADLLMICLSGGVIDILAWWLVRSPETTREEVAATIERLIVVPMRSGYGA